MTKATPTFQQTDLEIATLLKEVREKLESIKSLRQSREKEPIANHTLKKPNGDYVQLSDLFGDADELLIIHNMGKGCAYCTLWADGLRGYASYMSKRMPFVLVSPDKPEVLTEFAAQGKWNFDYVSGFESDFTKALGFEYERNGKRYFQPGASALIKGEDGQIYRTGYDSFGPGDLYCPPWHFFDLFPKSDNNWQPRYER